MTFLWYSAFDPIFWLHHAQVDRLVAIWQAIHPYTYIKPKASTITTYYVPVGTIQDENSPLAPFHKNGEGGFYTGQTVRRLKTFGYSYPELVYWSKTGSDVLSLQKEVISTVNGLYHPKYAMINEELNGAEANKLNLYLPTGSSLGADWEWKFELNINQAQIETPMAVYFFNSNHSLASGSVRMKNGRFIIGPKVFLLPKTEEKMATPFSSSSASVPLTQTLLSLGSLEPDMVLPWIKNNILWRSVKPPDYDAHGADVGSTDEQAAESHIPHSAIEMTLVARKIAQSSNRSKFPIYGPWMEYGSTRLMGHGGHVDLDF